jgi:phosphopantetheinyl transferase (holo-ACP synthase)
MATTSSTSSSEWAISSWQERSCLPLLGSGVDLERADRFLRYVDPQADVWPLVFSERELGHARAQLKPARALCAAFCAKEAFTKALRAAAFEYTECELLYAPDEERQPLLLAEALTSSLGVAHCEAQVRWPTSDECLVVVYVYGKAP